ncbi:hypothetical protein T35B1_11397 [Salinisphaera shabanensis T35B1]|uniref:hypothetical protein n=1 Tax=Salinisphaera shabanensis TaxID=180542 RepID=UPI0033411F3B
MKFVIGYSVQQMKEVKVGIEAANAEEALAKARLMFDNGKHWDESNGCVLLQEALAQSEVTPRALEFTLSEELGDNDYPLPHASVRAIEKTSTAHAVVEQLVEAYRRSSETGEPVRAKDIEAAYWLALECQL